jgi:hypothetical protein
MTGLRAARGKVRGSLCDSDCFASICAKQLAFQMNAMRWSPLD